MKSYIYIVNYNNINYIFIDNIYIEQKFDNKEILLSEELLKYKYSDKNLDKINSIIKLGNYELINYEITRDTTIYKLRYIIHKYIDEELLYENQHLTIKCDIDYGSISDILFKIYTNLDEVETENILDYYKLLGFNVLNNIKTPKINYNDIKKNIEWDNNNNYITLGYELININNNIELYFDGNFYNKNINVSIFELFLYYNTNNKTLNEFNIDNNIIYVYNYYKEDNYKNHIKHLLKDIIIDYKEDINIVKKRSLNKIVLSNSYVNYYELHYNNKFNNYDIDLNFSKYKLSEKIPFIKIKNNKSEYNYKIFINKVNDIPYIEQDILETWINTNDNIRLNSIQLKVKYLSDNNYYDIYITKYLIRFVFNLNENIYITVEDIHNNINNILKTYLDIPYIYNIMNPLFTLNKIRLKYSYTINNINYKNIYYRLLFILLLDYENILVDIDYIRRNISKIDNIKTILFTYKNSLNYIYPIKEMNQLRNAVTFTAYNKIIEEYHNNNIDDAMIKIYGRGVKKISCEIKYNNNIFDIVLKNITNYKKIYDLDILLNDKLNIILHDISLINLFNNFKIHDMNTFDTRLFKNDLSENLFIYKQFIEVIYNKLDINEDVMNDIDDDFFEDLEDIDDEQKNETIVEFTQLIKKTSQSNKRIILNINNGDYKYSIFPKKLLEYLNLNEHKKGIYNLNINNFNNYNFEILVCIINFSISFKLKKITFAQILKSQVFNFLNNLKIIINNIPEYINIILNILEYITELDISVINNIRFELLNKNVVELFLMLLDFEYISSKNIERYNKNIYKKLGFVDYNQYSQLVPLERQPTYINTDLYNILLENDTTGSVDRIFNNSLLTKKISNEYYLCLINNLHNQYSLLPIIDNITDDINLIYCHSFDYKHKRKINIKDINEIKYIDFTNSYMFPYNIGNISSNDIVKSIGYQQNKQKYIKNIYDISILLRVGVPINNIFSSFINSILFALGKTDISIVQFMNDIKLKITNKIFKKLNNGSLYYIFKKKIIDKNISLSSLISTYMSKSSLYEEIDDPYSNFLNYIQINLKYIDHDIGLHLLSELFNINIVIFTYNISNIIFHELICPVNGIVYNFKDKNTIILIKYNNIYELVISYNYFAKYKYVFNMSDKYFKNNNLIKLLNKCKLKDNNITYYNAFNFDDNNSGTRNPIVEILNNTDMEKFNILYNVLDNYNLVGFIVLIKKNDYLFIPINILVDNIQITEKPELDFNTIIENKKYIFDYKTTLNKLNRLYNMNILSDKLQFNNKVVLDNLVPSHINAIILNNNNYIPIIPTNLNLINLKNLEIVENDEIYMNNIIKDVKKYKMNINSTQNDYYNFKRILNNLFKNNILNKELKNILLKNDILNIFNYLTITLKEYNIKPTDKIFIEHISYELLNNYITRYDILDKYIIDDIYTNIVDNVLILTETNLKTIGIANIYKSFYYNNNNLYTGNILNNIELYTQSEIICNKKEPIPDEVSLLQNFSYYTLKYINNNNIIGYSECIYYNLEKVLNIDNLRDKIFNYIKSNNLLKIYIDNIRNETNSILYSDINSFENLELIINSNNHWITLEDIKYIVDIGKINIIIIDTLNRVKLFIHNDSKKYIIIYEYLLYSKKIYYLVCNETTSLFDYKVIKYLIHNIETHKDNYEITDNTISTINNQYLYNIQTDKFTIINLFAENIILDFDILDIFNEIILTWKNMPFNYSPKFIKILNKLNINSKVSEKILNQIIKYYPNIEYNEPIIFPPFYHLEYIWELRQNKQIYNIFSNIYDNNKLMIKYDSITILVKKTEYFKTYNNINSNERIFGFLCLTPIILSYINDIDYINNLFKTKNITTINYNEHQEFRIDNTDIDQKYIQTIKLDKGILYLFSESLLYNLDIHNFILGIIVDINYYPQNLYSYNKQLRIDSYEHGMSYYNNFNLTHYKNIDIERVFNYFKLDIYKDNGLFLYNNYKNFKSYSPIIYNNFVKLLNEYDPKRIIATEMEKNKIKLNILINDSFIHDIDNIIVNTLYNNKKIYTKLSKLGIHLIIGW